MTTQSRTAEAGRANPVPSEPMPSEPGSNGAASTVPLWPRVVGAIGTRRVWLPTMVVFLAFAATMFASSAPYSIPTVTEACGQAPPDVRPYPSGDEVDAFLGACGATGRNAYSHLQLADLFYPVVFGVFLASSIALVAGRLRIHPRRVATLAAIPLLATAFDYLENVFAWTTLTRFPAMTAASSLLGFASLAKTLTSWLAGAVLLVLAGALVIERVRVRSARARTPRM